VKREQALQEERRVKMEAERLSKKLSKDVEKRKSKLMALSK